jgi:hypothetical protein
MTAEVISNPREIRVVVVTVPLTYTDRVIERGIDTVWRVIRPCTRAPTSNKKKDVMKKKKHYKNTS